MAVWRGAARSDILINLLGQWATNNGDHPAHASPHPITNGHYLTLSVPCMCNVYWGQPGPSNQLAAAYQANRYKLGGMREYCIYIKLKTLMQSIALHQWQGRPQPSLTHNLNVSVKEKAKKMFPVCGMFNMSRCWC